MQITTQRYEKYFNYAIAYIVKSSTIFKTRTPKCGISVSHDIQFLRLTLKIEPISAICSLQLVQRLFGSPLSGSPSSGLEDGELDIGCSCPLVVGRAGDECSDIQTG